MAGPTAASRARSARIARARIRREHRRAVLVLGARRSAVVAGATVVMVVLAALLVRPAPAATTAGPDARAQAVATVLTHDATLYRQAVSDAERQDEDAAKARTAGRAARAQSAQDRLDVGRYAAALYEEGAADRDPLTTLSLRAPGNTAAVLHRQALGDQLSATRDSRVTRAADAAVTAATFTDEVTRATAAAAAERSRATLLLHQIRGQVDRLTPQMAARWAALRPAGSPTSTTDITALTRWQQYLGQLATAGITPPPVSALTDPGTFPAGLAPLRSAAGAVEPGVAAAYAGGQMVTVLPAETVAAVTAALADLGTGYSTAASGAGFDCGGLVSAVEAEGGVGLPLTLAGQWAAGTPVSPADLQVGDLVFSPKAGVGLDDVGIWLGGGSVLSDSADTGRAAVHTVTDVSRAVRVSVAPSTPTPVPVAQTAPATCSAPPPRAVTGPAANPAWGGYSNGQIPDSALCPIAPGQRLRCDAAAAYTAMSTAYEQVFGTPLCITDSYRSLAVQLSAHRAKPMITAVPGTSNHGWGLAVDLCGGINAFGTAQTAWMRANAATFGWVHPAWAEDGSQIPEPWHWEFGHIS